MPATFDLDTVPKPSRHATLRDLMAHIPVPIDVRTSSIDRLHVSTVSDFFGRIFLVSCNGRGAVVGRDQTLVRVDHARTMMLSVVTAGTSRLQQGDTSSDLRRGDVVAYSSDRPYRATFDDVSKHTYMVDYEALACPTRSSTRNSRVASTPATRSAPSSRGTSPTSAPTPSTCQTRNGPRSSSQPSTSFARCSPRPQETTHDLGSHYTLHWARE
jgi:hypothetical protein